MKIEKGIPLEPRPLNGKARVSAIWHSMEVGDSVLVGEPGDLAAKHSHKQTYAKKITGHKFETRAVPEGVRIWRTA